MVQLEAALEQARKVEVARGLAADARLAAISVRRIPAWRDVASLNETIGDEYPLASCSSICRSG
jgi:hypothetical protein